MKTAKNLNHYCPVCGELLTPAVAYRMERSPVNRHATAQQEKNTTALKKRVAEKERSYLLQKMSKKYPVTFIYS